MYIKVGNLIVNLDSIQEVSLIERTSAPWVQVIHKNGNRTTIECETLDEAQEVFGKIWDKITPCY